MHKFPAGSTHLFWPAAWGFILGARDNRPEWTELGTMMAILFFSATLLHCAACVINDICDIDFDRQVERTKNRPLASGAVSVPAAWVFLLIQVGIFFWLLSYVNTTSFYVGTFGVFPLHALYPLMKRVTMWPQAWLGLAMNWGLPTAWLITSPADVKSSPMWALTFGAFCWTILYDTIYACQDRKDDVKAGVKSTALLFGDWVKQILGIFAVAFVATLAYAGYQTNQSWVYFTISVGGCAAHLLWQLVTLDPDVPEDCWAKFDSNGTLGFIVAGGMVAEWIATAA